MPEENETGPDRIRQDGARSAGGLGVPDPPGPERQRQTLPLREIIEARDVLIVDANMAAIGTENSRACMHFLLRMLHAQLQRQVHLPEADRPPVPLIVDEAHGDASILRLGSAGRVTRD